MFFSRLSSCVLLALTAIGVSAVPMFDKEIGTPKKVDARMFDKEIGTPKHVSSKRAVNLEAPHWVVYADKWQSGVTGPPPVESIAGYNVFNLAFLLTAGPYDKAQEWALLTADERASIKQAYNDAGISLCVSVFGATDAPTSSGADPVELANTMAQWVIDYNLDGIDVDYEDFNAINAQDGKAEDWLISFTKALREKLPVGEYILTHAPVTPWFSTPAVYPTGAYRAVHEGAGDLIDWYNLQFYNQGTSEYTDCAGLLDASSNVFPETAVFELIAWGLPAEKVVIGKPATTGDANNGFIDGPGLAACVAQAKEKSWNGGVMFWQYPNADSALISTVRGSAFPV